MKYKYIFGPVPSRRLGISLGIDLIPHKTCSFDCIYCECGKTTLKTIKTQNFVNANSIKKELTYFLNNNNTPDYITFSGSGEPLLYSDIEEIILFIKNNFPNIKIALLTNSSLLTQKHILNSIKLCNLILPSLDAAIQKTFEQIDRPFPGIKVNDIIKALKQLKIQMYGKMFLEIFLLPGYNDDNNNLIELKKAIHYIKPDKVQLNTIDRPGTKKQLLPMSKKRLQEIALFFEYKNTEIISKYKHRKEITTYNKDFETLIISTLNRRPLTIDDIAFITNKNKMEILKYLDILIKEKKIKTQIKERGIFYIGVNNKTG